MNPSGDRPAAGTFGLITSELTMAEVLVKPIRDNDQTLLNIYLELFFSLEIKLIPTTSLIWKETANLRALSNLRTPDVVQAAAALQEGRKAGRQEDCTALVTNDRAFRRIEGLNVIVLEEALPAP